MALIGHGIAMTQAARIKDRIRDRLGPELLLGMSPDEAVAWLQRSPGMGPWMSWFVLIRGAGHPDLTPPREPRLAAAVLDAYGRPLEEVSDAWRPVRSWAAFLFRAAAGA